MICVCVYVFVWVCGLRVNRGVFKMGVRERETFGGYHVIQNNEEGQRFNKGTSFVHLWGVKVS